MQEVESVSATYTPLAQACSSVFFCLEQLSTLNHFYRFSLEFFFEIFNYILHKNPSLVNVTDPNQRLRIILRDLFIVAFKRASLSLLHEDQTILALLLSQIKVRQNHEDWDETAYNLFLGNSYVNESGTQLDQLKSFSAFKDIDDSTLQNSDEWKKFHDSSEPELMVPACWNDDNLLKCNF
jgi:dynein heavy chain 1, cytosolic